MSLRKLPHPIPPFDAWRVNYAKMPFWKRVLYTILATVVVCIVIFGIVIWPVPVATVSGLYLLVHFAVRQLQRNRVLKAYLSGMKASDN